MSRVSDHAVLRWLERVAGVDVEAVRKHLESPTIETAEAFGCGTVIMGDGTRMKLSGDVVCTVLAKRRRR